MCVCVRVCVFVETHTLIYLCDTVDLAETVGGPVPHCAVFLSCSSLTEVLGADLVWLTSSVEIKGSI